MFIGHFGIGLAAKKTAPKVSLGTLFFAAQLLDLLWPAFVLLGWEHFTIEPGITKMAPLNFTDYPLSHSLLMSCVWGLLAGLAYYFIKRNRKGAVIIALCVISHWVLDLLVHRPDLPLYPGGPLIGFGLWNMPATAIIIEALVFLAGLILYLQATVARNLWGKFVFWILILFLVLIHVGNLFSPPPTNVKAVAWAAMSQWIIVLWAYWADYNRTARQANN